MKWIAVSVFGLVMAFSLLAAPVAVLAELPKDPPVYNSPKGKCAGDDIELLAPLGLDSAAECVDGDAAGGPIIAYMRAAIRVASAAVGLIVVLAIVLSGLQYILSQGRPADVQAAKGRLMQALIGLMLWIFMYGILELLLPGGVFL